MDLVNHLEGRLLFAVPKKGRLQQATLDLLSGSDIQFRREHRLDIALVKNHPLALIFLPAADIPTFVGEGRVDLGITGRDQVAEHAATASYTISTTDTTANNTTDTTATGAKPDTTAQHAHGVEEILDCGFGRCRLMVQVPEKGEIQTPEQLVGRNVVTSFVGLAERYFAKLEGVEVRDGCKVEGLRTRIMYVGGSVEAACALGVADGIVDLVESGETMKAAGLKDIDTVVDSTAVLIKSKRPSNPKLVDLIASRIKGVINAQKYVFCQYNVPRDKLSAVLAITPGKRAPTVTSLDEENWAAISSMVLKSEIATVMDNLAEAGATDILVFNIMNSRTE